MPPWTILLPIQNKRPLFILQALKMPVSVCVYLGTSILLSVRSHLVYKHCYFLCFVCFDKRCVLQPPGECLCVDENWQQVFFKMFVFSILANVVLRTGGGRAATATALERKWEWSLSRAATAEPNSHCFIIGPTAAIETEFAWHILKCSLEPHTKQYLPFGGRMIPIWPVKLCMDSDASLCLPIYSYILHSNLKLMINDV